MSTRSSDNIAAADAVYHSLERNINRADSISIAVFGGVALAFTQLSGIENNTIIGYLRESVSYWEKMLCSIILIASLVFLALSIWYGQLARLALIAVCHHLYFQDWSQIDYFEQVNFHGVRTLVRLKKYQFSFFTIGVLLLAFVIAVPILHFLGVAAWIEAGIRFVHDAAIGVFY